MPYLRFKGFDAGLLQELRTEIVAEFARIAALPRELVKIELLTITRITTTPRSLEIFMFPRPQAMHDAIAATLHALLDRCGYPDVHIFFVLLAPSLYYKEGLPLTDIEWLSATH